VKICISGDVVIGWDGMGGGGRRMKMGIKGELDKVVFP